MVKKSESTIALAVCETCALVWMITLLSGTVYLIGWQGWSPWTFTGMFLLMCCWTCAFCPGHAKYGKESN
jgi:hypothetical protein